MLHDIRVIWYYLQSGSFLEELWMLNKYYLRLKTSLTCTTQETRSQLGHWWRVTVRELCVEGVAWILLFVESLLKVQCLPLFLQPVCLAWVGWNRWTAPHGLEKAGVVAGRAAELALASATGADWSHCVTILLISGFLHPRRTRPNINRVGASPIVAGLMVWGGVRLLNGQGGVLVWES